MASGEPTSYKAWLFVASLTAVVTAVSTFQSLRQYDELRSAWSWDVAYYNQWFWALTRGDRIITVRPIAGYAVEGPSVWKMNYLAPIRSLLVPFYLVWPGPQTLLVIQNVMFWWVIPAAFTLVRSESRSEWVALSAAALVPLTPLLWPLAWNDFRELQLAGPFVLWAVQGVRSRALSIAGVGIAGALACRQEFAVMVATLAFLPPRDAEGLSTTLKWRTGLLLTGTLWLFLGFFGYLRFMVARTAPDHFIDEFLVPSATALQTVRTAAETLLIGMGVWAILACLAPRVAIFAIPWIWGVCRGRWALWMLSTDLWSLVRYVAPATFLFLASGLVGYARLATALLKWPSGRRWLVLVWLAAAAGSGAGLHVVAGRLAHVPVAIDRSEAEAVWRWIRQVGPDDAVVADIQVSAPLSSRPKLYSDILDQNLPGGSATLGPEIRWLFISNRSRYRNFMLEQGFEIVHHGKWLTIARRMPTPIP